MMAVGFMTLWLGAGLAEVIKSCSCDRSLPVCEVRKAMSEVCKERQGDAGWEVKGVGVYRGRASLRR